MTTWRLGSRECAEEVEEMAGEMGERAVIKSSGRGAPTYYNEHRIWAFDI